MSELRHIKIPDPIVPIDQEDNPDAPKMSFADLIDFFRKQGEKNFCASFEGLELLNRLRKDVKTKKPGDYVEPLDEADHGRVLAAMTNPSCGYPIAGIKTKNGHVEAFPYAENILPWIAAVKDAFKGAKPPAPEKDATPPADSPASAASPSAPVNGAGAPEATAASPAE